MIYVIGSDGGPVKIGYTRDARTVRNRLSNLQVGYPRKLKLFALADGGFDEESALHALLSKFKKQGEWFDDGDWMDPMLTHCICLLSRYSARFVLDHADLLYEFCPTPGGPVPLVRPRKGYVEWPAAHRDVKVADLN